MKLNLVTLVTIVMVTAFLGGCSSTQLSKLKENSMLDTAPASELDVRYPEWSEPVVNEREINLVEGPMGIQKTDVAGSFSQYLQQLGLEHEIVPGDHLIIKLSKKVMFKTGSSLVSRQSKEWLSQLGNYISSLPQIEVILEGHADDRGDRAGNDVLSEKRAMGVKQVLVKQGVRADNIYTRGFGEYMPACSNSTRPGKACNRRVELTFLLVNNAGK